MVTVTAKAKEKLKELLQGRTTDPEEAMRIIASPFKPKAVIHHFGQRKRRGLRSGKRRR